MKRLLLTLILAMAICIGAFAQHLTYQAVIRDANQQLVANTAVKTNITINFTASLPYTIEIQGVTNANGLLSFDFGDATLIGRDWENATMTVTVTNASNANLKYVDNETRDVNAVPYALSVNGQSIQNYLDAHHYLDSARTINAIRDTAVNLRLAIAAGGGGTGGTGGVADCNAVNACVANALADGNSQVNNAVDTIAQNVANNYINTLQNQINDLLAQVGRLRDSMELLHPDPVMTIFPSTTGALHLCDAGNVTVTYTAVVENAMPGRYYWKVNGTDSASVYGNTLTVRYATTGAHKVTCEAGNASDTVTTTVQDGGELPVLALCESCDAGTVKVKVSRNISTLVWRNSDGDSVSNSTTALVQSASIPAGNYTVTAKNSNGCGITQNVKLGNPISHPCTVWRLREGSQDGSKWINKEYGTDSQLDSVSDHEGNVYRVVEIGTGANRQCWLAENMRCTTTPRAGQTMGSLTMNMASTTDYPDSYAPYYGYSADGGGMSLREHGYLYNYSAMMDTVTSNFVCGSFTNHRGICPEGWHIPTNEEMTTLYNNAGVGTDNSGSGLVKLAGGCEWVTKENGSYPGSYSNAERNATGFSAVPAGFSNGRQVSWQGEIAIFWTSSRSESVPCAFNYAPEFKYSLQYVYNSLIRVDRYNSVRCLRDNESGIYLDEISCTDSTENSLSISAQFTNVSSIGVDSATLRAFTDANCTAAAGNSVKVTNPSSPVTGTITGLADNTPYWVKVTLNGTESKVAGPFRTKSITSYTITLFPNGDVKSYSGAATQTITGSANLTTIASAYSSLSSRANWEFAGWSTNPDGTGTTYADGQSYTATANDTLYAQWRTYCTVVARSANENGGTTTRVDSVKDHENNFYKVVQIGNQCWLKENMRATTKLDGTSILQNPHNRVYDYDIPRAYYYADSEDNYQKYGCLYNFPAVMNVTGQPTSFTYPHRGICPEGWHVPDTAEFDNLATNAGCGRFSGLGKLTGGYDWTTCQNCTGQQPGNYAYAERNSSGFSVLPAGRYFNNGSFDLIGSYTYFWIANPNGTAFAYFCELERAGSSVNIAYDRRDLGFSLRCVRDEQSGLTLGEVTKTASTTTSLTVSAAYTVVSGVTVSGATLCAYTDADCTTPAAGICASSVSYNASPITGTISGLTAGTDYYVKVTATTANGTESKIAGPFSTDNPAYTITFFPNGDVKSYSGAATQTITGSANLTTIASAYSSLSSRANWEFAGWSTNPDGTGTTYADGQSYTATANDTLYAQWRTYCTVVARSANENGGSTTRVDSVKDHENNFYKVVQIGNQCWLKENMRATTKPDGTIILQNPHNSSSYSQPRAYYYNDSESYYRKYGCLYNFPAAMNITGQPTSFTYPHRGICPEGWHVPDTTEFDALETNAGCGTYSGLGKLTGGYDWTTCENCTGQQPGNYAYAERNSSGFSVLPAGQYNEDAFQYAGSLAYLWSAVSGEEMAFAKIRFIHYNDQYVKSSSSGRRGYGYSLRCVRDEQTGLTLGEVTKTASDATSLTVSAAYTVVSGVTVSGATLCAYTDAACTTPAAGICASSVSYNASPIAGTISGLTAGTDYYVKVTATTANGTESKIAGPFSTDNPAYTITFFPNGDVKSYSGAATQSITDSDTLKSITTVYPTWSSRANWEFVNWSTNPDGTGDIYTNKQSYTATADDTLYAQWRTYCTVVARSANENGGTTTRVDSVQDHENNFYKVVQIGNQCWLKENMRATTSPRQNQVMGDNTMNLVESTTSFSSIIPYYYDNTNFGVTNLRNRGYLYNWSAAVDTVTSSTFDASFTNRRGICPAGWHLPTLVEWNKMDTNAEIVSTGLGKLSSGFSWYVRSETTAPGNYNYNDRNSSGFSAIPVGYCKSGTNHFDKDSSDAYFWSSTPYSSYSTYGVFINCSWEKLCKDRSYEKSYGFSVRCVRDEQTGLTLGEVSKTASTTTSLTVSAAYTAVSGVTVTSATVCAYTDADCTTPAAGICASSVSYNASPITGTISGLTAGTDYYVKVTATTANGTESKVAGPFTTVPPTLTIASDKSSDTVSLCGQSSVAVTYTATVQNGTATSYTWSTSGGTATASTNNTYTVTYTSAGNYTVSCTAEGAGVSATNTVTIVSGGTAATMTISENYSTPSIIVTNNDCITS